MEFVDSLLGQEVMAAASLDGAECLPPTSYFLETNEPVLICGRRFKGGEDEGEYDSCYPSRDDKTRDRHFFQRRIFVPVHNNR
jgi:hypothetical protein